MGISHRTNKVSITVHNKSFEVPFHSHENQSFSSTQVKYTDYIVHSSYDDDLPTQR